MDKGGGGKTLIHKMWIKRRVFFIEPFPNLMQSQHQKDGQHEDATRTPRDGGAKKDVTTEQDNVTATEVQVKGFG